VTRFEISDIVEAADRLRGVAVRTPVVTSEALDRISRGEVFLKAENLQRTGSFKFRGAYNRISTLPAGTAGVAAYSSGNHAQAVALAARLAGLPAVVVMPEDAPPSKVESTRGYGAEIIPYDRYSQDRVELATTVAEERGLVLVPPYEDLMVMAGQGTAALELFREVRDLDVLVAPVGGGGLMAGSATVAKAFGGAIRTVGVEPEAGDDTRRSLLAGKRVEIPVPRTIADGLQVTSPGRQTFDVNRTRLDHVITVSDEELVDAMAFAFEYLKLVLEPSGAAGLAAVLTQNADSGGARIGVILSGGNVSSERFADLLATPREH
jgi:threonine dehydratase